MANTDAPALRLRIENLRLVPATPYDQERLSTYRNGSELRAVITQPKNEKLNRKFHAILHRVIADCETPWKTVEEAKDSLKMALGITRQIMRVDGRPERHPGSLADLDEPAFVDFYEGAIAVLHKITGVDPETLNAESTEVGEDEHESSAPSPADEAAASNPPARNPTDAAAPPSAAVTGGEADGEEDASEAAHGETAAPSPSEADDEDRVKIRRMLMQECIDNLLRDAVSEPAAERLGKIDKGERIWKGELPDHHGFVEKVAEMARRIAAKPGDQQKAREYLLAKVA